MTSLFIFLRRGVQYAVPNDAVREIVSTADILPSRIALPGCLGIVAHLGHLLPVLDPAALDGDAPGACPGRFVMVDAGDARVGLAMDDFLAVEAFDSEPEQQRPAPNRMFDKAHAYRGDVLRPLSLGAVGDLVRAHFAGQVFDAAAGDDGGRTTEIGAGDVHICVGIGGLTVAIRIDAVQEIAEGCAVTRLFKVPTLLRGLINLRGQVLACLDIAPGLGLSLHDLSETSRFVVLRHLDAELALCVDRIGGITRLPLSVIRGGDAALTGEARRLFNGLYEAAGGTVLLLDVMQLFGAGALAPYTGMPA